MEKYSVPPAWLETLGWISLAVAFVSLLCIAHDIFVRGHRQKMPVMEAVYPLAALYWGSVAVWFYLKHGRIKSPKYMKEHGRQINSGSDNKVRWNQASEAVTHCGAGCTLGDIAGEWIVFAAGLMLLGKSLYTDFIFDFTLA